MSSETMRSEVGEKTAFRRRLLMAWQMTSQLRYNADIHRRWMHILQSLIIFFSFISVLFGTAAFPTSAPAPESQRRKDPSRGERMIVCDPRPRARPYRVPAFLGPGPWLSG
jgi:hypothetical protein